MLQIEHWHFHEKNIGYIYTDKLCKASKCSWALQFDCLYSKKC